MVPICWAHAMPRAPPSLPLQLLHRRSSNLSAQAPLWYAPCDLLHEVFLLDWWGP